MNVGYKHTPHKSSTASGLIVSKGPLFPQKHRPAKFSGYVLVSLALFRWFFFDPYFKFLNL